MTGLDAGADDYLVSPLIWRSLSARVRALLRRPNPLVQEDEVLRYGDIVFRSSKLLLEGSKASAVLAKKEAELLEQLLRADGRHMERGILFHKIWGNESDVDDRNLDNYIISYVNGWLPVVLGLCLHDSGRRLLPGGAAMLNGCGGT